VPLSTSTSRLGADVGVALGAVEALALGDGVGVVGLGLCVVDAVGLGELVALAEGCGDVGLNVGSPMGVFSPAPWS